MLDQEKEINKIRDLMKLKESDLKKEMLNLQFEGEKDSSELRNKIEE